MNITKITAYKTEDGRIFEVELDAVRHSIGYVKPVSRVKQTNKKQKKYQYNIDIDTNTTNPYLMNVLKLRALRHDIAILSAKSKEIKKELYLANVEYSKKPGIRKAKKCSHLRQSLNHNKSLIGHTINAIISVKLNLYRSNGRG